MARAKNNLLGVIGKLGDFVVYQLDGKDVVRRAASISKARYRKDASFQRMRENSAEFGGASLAGKSLREGFAPFSKNSGDPYISGRLNGVFRNIISSGAGERGRREFAISEHGEMLKGFEFNSKSHISESFRAKYLLTKNANRMGAELYFASFDPGIYVNAPKGATHLKVIFAICALSDYGYDARIKSYLPEVSFSIGSRSAHTSLVFPLNTDNTGPLTLNSQLNFAEALPVHSELITCLGIEFMQEVNGELYEMKEGKGMRVV